VNKQGFECPNIIKDLVIVKLGNFRDDRGMNFEGYNESFYSKFPVFNNLKFSVDSFSRSNYGVIRGFHGDQENHKLIQCLHGAIFFVVIDRRIGSNTFNNVFKITLSSENPEQILVPSGCVNAHQCITNQCLFSYKLTNSYVDQNKQIHVKWNDPLYNITWPIPNPILSNRDK
jgi:dTDP-4-dehydrorhamnose 3,5-epimerase